MGKERKGTLKRRSRSMSTEVASQVELGTAVMEPNNEPAVSPSGEQIAALAYSYWEARGCQGGSPEEDWFRAERELRERQSQGGAANIQEEGPPTRRISS
jgi:hypothetical protein